MYRRLKDSVILRQKTDVGLLSFDSPTGRIGQQRVRVVDCVRWAIEKQILLPPPLAILEHAPPPADEEPPKSMDDRERVSYLNTIGALLKLLLGNAPSGKPHFPSQARIIEVLLATYTEKKFGLSKRSLEENFAAANRSIEQK
jgi:hypothetical protein